MAISSSLTADIGQEDQNSSDQDEKVVSIFVL